MDILFWIVGVALVGVAWVLNIITKFQLASGDIDSAIYFQSLAGLFSSFGFGWLIGQIISCIIRKIRRSK